MRYFTRAGKPIKRPREKWARLRAAQWLLVLPACVVVSAVSGHSQDNGTKENEFRGNGAEIAVTVHDSAGEPISAPTTVRLYRDGTIPSGQGATSNGSVVFIVTSLGEFTVVVEAAGYPSVRKDASVEVAGRVPVDVYLRRDSAAGVSVGVPGRPILAPKAKDAFDKGMRALSADKLREAEKFVGEAVRLAPGHPDVLYVRGVLYLKEQNWEGAQGALEKATQIDPSHARAFAALGMAFSDQGKYDLAIAPLEKSLQLDAAGGWETHWALAKGYYRLGRYDAALKNSQAALEESKGKTPEIELLVAQSLTAVGRYEDAAQTLRGFLKEHGERREAATARRWLDGLQANGKIARE